MGTIEIKEAEMDTRRQDTERVQETSRLIPRFATHFCEEGIARKSIGKTTKVGGVVVDRPGCGSRTKMATGSRNDMR